MWSLPPGASVMESTAAPIKRKSFKKIKDPNSGNFYYHNDETDETTWDEPIDAEIILE